MGKVEWFNDTNSPSKLIYTYPNNIFHALAGDTLLTTKGKRQAICRKNMVKTSTITNKNNPQVIQAVTFSSLIWAHKNRLRFAGHENSPSPKSTPIAELPGTSYLQFEDPQKFELTRPTHNPTNSFHWCCLGTYPFITSIQCHRQRNNPTTAAPFGRDRHPPSTFFSRLLAMSIAPFEPHTTLATGSPFVQSHVPTRKNLAGGFGW